MLGFLLLFPLLGCAAPSFVGPQPKLGGVGDVGFEHLQVTVGDAVIGLRLGLEHYRCEVAMVVSTFYLCHAGIINGAIYFLGYLLAPYKDSRMVVEQCTEVVYGFPLRLLVGYHSTHGGPSFGMKGE